MKVVHSFFLRTEWPEALVMSSQWVRARMWSIQSRGCFPPSRRDRPSHDLGWTWRKSIVSVISWLLYFYKKRAAVSSIFPLSISLSVCGFYISCGFYTSCFELEMQCCFPLWISSCLHLTPNRESSQAPCTTDRITSGIIFVQISCK